MNASQSRSPISDLLRRTIVESGVSYNALQKETGVTRASIMRFVRGDQSLRLDMADRLAEYFGLELQEARVGTMGSVFKKTVTRPLPPGAEIIVRQGVRLARWRDGKGKMRTAPVTTGQDGTERIRDESSTYFARYRDGNGIVVEVPTGCRDETAARQVLADLERRAERVRAGSAHAGRSPDRRAPDDADRRARRRLPERPRRGRIGPVAPAQRPDLPEPARRRLRLRPARRPEPRSPGAMARQRRRRRGGRPGPATRTGPRSSRSPTGAPTRASAGSRPTRSRGCRRPTRRPTLAAAAGR